MDTTSRLEGIRPVTGINAVAPSSSTPDYVSMRHLNRLTVIIKGKNTTGVTGSAITLKQATAVAGTSEKALAFSYVYSNAATGSNSVLTKTTVTSNTFTTTNTNSVEYMYVIDVDPATLDSANSFDCVRVGTGDATNTTLDVTYLCHMRHGGWTSALNPIVD